MFGKGKNSKVSYWQCDILSASVMPQVIWSTSQCIYLKMLLLFNLSNISLLSQNVQTVKNTLAYYNIFLISLSIKPSGLHSGKHKPYLQM
jgi:hypothetical protein